MKNTVIAIGITMSVLATNAPKVSAFQNQNNKYLIETLKNLQNIDKDIDKNKKEEILKEINKYRLEKGLNELKYSNRLDSIAQGYADYCVKNKWEKGHYDKEGKGFEARLNDAGYNGEARENIYFGWGDPEKITNRWKGSVTHNNNILFSKGNYISVGITKNKEDGSFAYVIIIFE